MSDDEKDTGKPGEVPPIEERPEQPDENAGGADDEGTEVGGG